MVVGAFWLNWRVVCCDCDGALLLLLELGVLELGVLENSGFWVGWGLLNMLVWFAPISLNRLVTGLLLPCYLFA